MKVWKRSAAVDGDWDWDHQVAAVGDYTDTQLFYPPLLTDAQLLLYIAKGDELGVDNFSGQP